MTLTITFCSTEFAGEERIMRKFNYDHLTEHIAAHKQLLTEIVRARRNASGEGLSLAVLDFSDMLDAYHKHVNTCDLAFGGSLVSPLRLVEPLHSHGLLPKAGLILGENIPPVGATPIRNWYAEMARWCQEYGARLAIQSAKSGEV